MNKKKKIVIITLSSVLAVILVLTSAFFILKYLGKHKFHKYDNNISASNVEVEDDVIYYKGKAYTLNKNIVSVLLMGVDRDSIGENLGYGKNGQADTIMLVAIDTKLETVKIIPISRETMVDINQYSATGDYVGTENRQICLAYAYGGNTEESSKNILTSVRRLLYGINVSSYITVDQEGISKLTQAMGGVTVNSLEDFTYKGKTYKAGSPVNLKGNITLSYLSRRDEDPEANNRRMLKHKQFVVSAINTAGNQILNDFSVFTEYYNAISGYIYTDLDISKLTYLTTEFLTKDMGNSIEFKTIEGVTTQGEKWMEFRPDEDSLTQTVINVFYNEVKNKENR